MTANIFDRQKQDWIEEGREIARTLLKRQYSITIEDVLRIHPLPKFLHKNTIGAVLNSNQFKRIGYEPAKKASSHGRVISVWTAKLPSDFETQEDADLPRNWRQLRKATEYEKVER